MDEIDGGAAASKAESSTRRTRSRGRLRAGAPRPRASRDEQTLTALIRTSSRDDRSPPRGETIAREARSPQLRPCPVLSKCSNSRFQSTRGQTGKSALSRLKSRYDRLRRRLRRHLSIRVSFRRPTCLAYPRALLVRLLLSSQIRPQESLLSSSRPRELPMASGKASREARKAVRGAFVLLLPQTILRAAKTRESRIG